MNCYSVSMGCYSNYVERMLFHEKKFSKDEFSEICKKVREKAIARDDFYSYAEDIAEIMINEHGFKKLHYLNWHAFDYSYDGKESDEIVLNEHGGIR